MIMRKIFTSLALAAISACTIGASAEQITLTPSVYEDGAYVYYNEETAEITKNADGTYTIADFLNSGKPVTITFEEPAWGGTSELKVVNADEEDYIICDGEGITVSVTSTEGVTKQFADVFYYSDSNSYIKKYTYVDELLNGTKYDALLFLATDEGDYMPVGFKFGEIEVPEAVETTVVTLRPSVSLDSKKVTCDKTFESELLKFEDGNYCITNFLGSNRPLVFSVDSVPSGDYGYYKIVGLNTKNESVNGSTYRYLYSNGERYSVNLKYNGEEHEFTDVRIYQNVKYTYSEDLSYFDDYEKATLFRFYGMTGDVETRFYMEFDYGKYEPIEETGDPEDVTLYLDTYNYDTENYEEYAKSVNSELKKFTKNIYEIPDFLNSGQPLDFTFEDPEAGSYSLMTIEQTYEAYAGYDPYLYGTGYYTIKLDKIVNEATDEYETETIEYVGYTPDYAYVYKYTAEEAAQYGYNYSFNMMIYGFIGDDDSDDIYVSFNFDKVNNGGSVGVENVVSDNAPVEYYTISGMKVENPQGGIYIRKQGSEVKKIIIK